MDLDSALVDLGTRWRAARAAASAMPSDEAEQLRRTFDNSLRLGQGYAGFHRAPIAPEQLPFVLPRLDAPCLRGRWAEVECEAGFWLERPPCQLPAPRAFCDHWREAINGLVLGLTFGVCHARHRSAGHGDPACVDLFYADPESPLRFGALPPELAPGLQSVRRLVSRFKGGARVEFLGVSEGELLYQLSVDPARMGCGGAGAHPLRQMVERCLRKRFPALSARELSPRPVLGAGAPPLEGTQS